VELDVYSWCGLHRGIQWFMLSLNSMAQGTGKGGVGKYSSSHGLNTWTRAEKESYMMQEHCLQNQRRKSGGRDMTSQKDKISNQHLTQKQTSC
jgi:hypothetical protein